MNLREVQSNPNIIKITLRFLDHIQLLLPLEQAADAPVSPLLYRSWLDIFDDIRKVFVHVRPMMSALEPKLLEILSIAC
jgi:hypothetical protein